MKELVIPEGKSLSIFTAEKGLDPFIKIIRDEVESFVPDTTTVKGRKAIASLSATVRSSKAFLESVGKEVAKELKRQPGIVDAERKRMKDICDDLAILARKPLTDWEDEQKRIAVEVLKKQKAEELLDQIESDHEIGLLLHEKLIAEEMQAVAEAERQRIEHEARIRQEATDAANAQAEQQRLDAKAALEKAEREKYEAIEQAKEQAEFAKQEAEAKAEQEKKNFIDSAQRAERGRLKAIENAKAQAEEAECQRIVAAERAKREIIIAEECAERRLNELQRQKEADELAEQERQEADKRNVGAKRKAAKECIMAAGFTQEEAKRFVMCVHNGEIDNIYIKYY